jgi:outer membrane protein OmpA-like peptidoglycan-associated protein
VPGVPATPPFNLLFGASYTVDPFHRYGVRFVERMSERRVVIERAPTTGDVQGTVIDAVTLRPVPLAIVEMSAGQPPVATDVRTGQFLTQQLVAGVANLLAHKEGYGDSRQDVLIVPGKTATIRFELQPRLSKARLLLQVASKKKPLQSIVRLGGAEERSIQLSASAKGPTPIEVNEGFYVLEVTATGYLAQTRQLQVPPNAEMPVSFELAREPKRQLVIVREDRIEILQQVHFATGKAIIMGDSFSLLDQVVDAIVRHNLKRVRVEGHTDNQGGAEYNLRLSAARSKAVIEYLAHAGIDSSRLESAGYGLARPLALNLTSKGRALNRRVEFMILER